CAEFCNHTHHYGVDGGALDFVQTQAHVGNRYGCAAQIIDGTVPNQYGTWVFGRGGWCPGLDVKPWRADLTQAAPAGEHTLRYEGRLDQMSYVPEPRAGDGFGARIDQLSAVVTWAAKP
ncbi:MAG: hypothetical protein KC613_07920, partial [Myxococcales bacterium]|nr:hypothetical protein [Myxococcales bacterium]